MVKAVDDDSLATKNPIEAVQDTMENKATDRIAPRSPTEASIICQPFTSNNALRAKDGVMRNFSCNGSYIETSSEFKSGTILIIRMTRCPSLPSSLAVEEGLRTICLAEVKWRQELTDENAIRFGMGVRYLD
jgi:hypothetical protein